MLLNKSIGWTIIISVSFTAIAILIMHILQPDKNPAVNAISEYVHGRYGALMTSTFFVQSIGSIAVAMLAMRMRPKKRKALIGGVFFIIAALGSALAGLFPADQISQTSLTSTGIIHTVGGLMRFISLAVTLPLLSSVLKKNERWQKQGRTLNILGILFVVIFLGTIFVLAPMNLFGLGQRIFITIVLAWMVIVSLPMLSNHQTEMIPLDSKLSS